MVGKILLFILILGAYLEAASVEARVDMQTVQRGESVELQIVVRGGNAAFPNLDQIGGIRVDSSSTSTSTEVRLVSGSMQKESTTTRSYTFVPVHDMIIPPYQIRAGSETLKTKPITIKVRQSQASSANKKGKYSFIMKSNKRSAVVGESFVVSLYIKISQQMGVQQIDGYEEPSSSAFFFKDFGEQKQYRQGTATIIKKQYIVTAKKEGNFTIASASVKLGVRDRRRQDMFGRYGVRWLNVRSNTLNIKVTNPVKQTDLVGEFEVKAKIDKQKVQNNQPVNLTVTIKGRGNLEDFEFPSYEIDGVTIYADEPKIESHAEGGKLVSTYAQSFAFISSGNFTIPSVDISTYHVATQKASILKIPHYEIGVAKRKSLAGTSDTDIVKEEKIADKNIATVQEEGISWWMLVLAFLLGMAVMYLERFIPKIFPPKERPYRENEALKILYAHISEEKAVEEMVRKLYARKNGDKSVTIEKSELKEMVNRFR